MTLRQRLFRLPGLNQRHLVKAIKRLWSDMESALW